MATATTISDPSLVPASAVTGLPNASPICSSASFVAAPSSDLGGGSPGRHVSPAPSSSTTATPPDPLHTGAAQLQGKCCCDCRIKKNLYTFSPKTCQELLKSGALTDDQLDFERQYLKSLGFNIDTRSRIKTSKESVLAALDNELSYHNCFNADRNLRYINTLTSNISYLSEQAEKSARNLKRVLPKTPVTAQRPDADSSSDESDSEQVVKLDSSVCNLFDTKSVDFSDISVNDVLSEIDVNSPATHGNRTIAYFGNTSYRYGAVKHEATPYPNSTVFETIFDRVKAVAPELSPSDFTCLVTHYPDGKSQIRFHSDDECQIEPGTNIYTVSIGAERTITFQNQSGVINEHHVIIPHGSLYSMSRASQQHWKHAILPDPSVAQPRVSFTFRRLLPESSIPHVQKPLPSRIQISTAIMPPALPRTVLMTAFCY